MVPIFNLGNPPRKQCAKMVCGLSGTSVIICRGSHRGRSHRFNNGRRMPGTRGNMQGYQVETIGQRVARARQFRGMTQGELANKSGVAFAKIRAIETSRYTITCARSIGIIAQTLNVTTDFLILGGVENGIEASLQRGRSTPSPETGGENRPVSWCSGLYND